MHSDEMHIARMEKSQRLKLAREMAKFETATDAADALHVARATYLAHENGSRGFDRKAAFYSAKFRVNLEWLLTGRGQPTASNKVDLLGFVGAGQKITPVDDHAKGNGLEPVDAPPGATAAQLVAVKVRGDSMYPAYRDGDVIFYGEHEPPKELIGREVVVKLTNDDMYVKTLETGSKPGLFTLSSHNASPLRDVKIEWASRVRYVAKA